MPVWRLFSKLIRRFGAWELISPAPAPFVHHEKKTELADYSLPAAMGGGAGAAVEQLFPERVCAG